MSTNEPLIEFNNNLSKLSKNEKDVLKLLVEAGKLIVPIYLKQENPKSAGANFYPKGATREEIEKAAQKDPKILSPYTVIERREGKLVVVPYHIKYAEYLKPIAEKLNQAASKTNNKEFAKILKIQAKSIIDGSYEKIVTARLSMKQYIIDFCIGPIDFDDDHLFSIKASYLSWVGVVNSEDTDRLNNYKVITLSARRKAFLPKERIEPKMIEAKVIDVVLFSGLMARTKFVGINLPYDIKIVEKYGSQITLFNQPNDLRVNEQILPTFKKVFSKGFKEGYNEDDLRRGYLRGVALHELAHSYLYYKDSAKNLSDLFPSIYELTATILGLRLAGTLLLKDRITEKQLESMIVAFLCRSYYLTSENKSNKSLFNYALGGKVFINFMLENGALRYSDNLVTVNFTKIFVSLHELSNILENLLSQGTRKDAEILFKKYS